MKIGEIARQSGYPIQAIRYYEGQGLLPRHKRTEGGYRIFTPDDLERLKFIKKAKHLGLSLTEIRAILAIRGKEEPTCEHVREILAHKLAEVEQALHELHEFQDVLATLLGETQQLEDCRPEGGFICSIIEQAPVMTQPAVMEKLKPN
ncbi:MAG: heavy metal-responsive transcriptional regulator [Chloroflexi bacterium]|nr:heavy metal-responsive transcriptional regulator [Chloroflexota bacterium]